MIFFECDVISEVSGEIFFSFFRFHIKNRTDILNPVCYEPILMICYFVQLSTQLMKLSVEFPLLSACV